MKKKGNNDLILDIETTGLPRDGRLVCIGCKEYKSLETKIFFNKNEEKMVIDFMRFFNKFKFNRIIGYCISHDYRFIVSRCLKFRIALGDFQFAKLIDIMKILKGNYHGYNLNRPGTLDQWSKFLVGRGKLDKDKSVKDLFSEDRIIDIIDYNRVDLEITYKIFERINQVMVVK